MLTDEQIKRMATEHLDLKVKIIDRQHPMTAKAPTGYHQGVAGRFATEQAYDDYLQRLQEQIASWQKLKARFKAHEVEEVNSIVHRLIAYSDPKRPPFRPESGHHSGESGQLLRA